VSDCSQCQAPDRRQFLRDVTAAVAGIMAALAATPREAAALPIALGRGLLETPGELTFPAPASDGATIDRDNEVILVRWKGQAFAFALSCPHQRTALKWLGADSRFQCPKHKSRYQPDGTFISGKATRSMDQYGIRKAGKSLVVTVARLYRNDKQPTEWAGARVAL
jgi:nitrite reductase/ring-hydroxylating ferredoxin subunit